jgi:hypothetical protein
MLNACPLYPVSAERQHRAADHFPSSLPASFSPTQPLFPYCLDAHCGCARCLAKCDADAAEGRIPLNGTWWWNQRAFVVEHGAGARVPGFFAEVAR